MTVQEFVRATTAPVGHVVILVSDHKTAAQGPAPVALEANHHNLFVLHSKRSATYRCVGAYYCSAGHVVIESP